MKIYINLVNQSKISFEKICEIREQTPRRICFATSHKSALKREENNKWIGKFAIPFYNSIYPIFYEMTKIKLFCNPDYDDYWRSIYDEEEFEKIKEFIKINRNIVFLRDTLALSIALSEHMDESEGRTKIGELEFQAKYRNDNKSLIYLVKYCKKIIDILPFYNKTKNICAIAPTQIDDQNLPNKIAKEMEENYKMDNISTYLSWENPKPILKELPFQQKWDALNKANLLVNINITGKSIILIDDLYQSGTTMQYSAMKLQQSGAKNIFGLALVKSRRDSDNQ